MSAPDVLTITPAEELRHLAAQCDKQASGDNRSGDRAFIGTLAARLFELGGCTALDFIARMIAEAADPFEAGRLPVDVIRSRAKALRLAADRLEPHGRAA